jgi:hypothetical protein
MKERIFEIWMRIGKWIFNCRYLVLYHHKGSVRGFTVCQDEWYADAISNIRKVKKKVKE